MVATEQSIEDIYTALDSVKDPEVPVLSLSELGVIREIKIENKIPIIKITPTYSGCPAMKVMELDIRNCLYELGYKHVEINQVLTPTWTTDWLTEKSKAKLKEYGIAPPCMSTELASNVTCPLCDSENTKLQSQFGATACKALYVCKDCKEPFEYFKAI